MAIDPSAYNSNPFLLVGAYSKNPSNWRLESYWGGGGGGVGAYKVVGADSVLYGNCFNYATIRQVSYCLIAANFHVFSNHCHIQ